MRYLLIVLIFCNVFVSVAKEQQKSADPENQVDIRQLEKIHRNLEEYIAKVNNYRSSIQFMTERRLKNLEDDLVYLQKKWDAYTQQNMDLISDETIDNMSLIGEFSQAIENVKEAITTQRAQITALASLEKLKEVFPEYEKTFADLYDKAEKLSMVKQGAKQLEQVKAETQLKFDELTKLFQSVKQAIPEGDASYTQKLEPIEANYIEISATVNSIQAMKYVPFIERIKNYMISIGVVALLIMLVNMILTKIKAAKAVKESMEKMKQMTQNNDIPTI